MAKRKSAARPGQEGEPGDQVLNPRLEDVAKRSKSVGRPRQQPEPGERVQLSFRVTPELKRRLDGAADKSGRSQSQEAEFRLERSFDHEDLLSEALTLAYGRKTAGLLMALAFVMVGVARWWIMPSSPKDTPFSWRPDPDKEWTEQPEVFEYAVQAVTTLLNAARPEGPLRVHAPGRGDPGGWFAHQLIVALRGENPHHPWIEDAENIKRLLGPIAERMSPEYDRANPMRLPVAVQPGATTAAPRSDWKGYLKLSLVSASIAMYHATTTTEKVREDEELANIPIESSHTVEIEKFVPKASIDDRYRDTPYYLAPEDKKGFEAFAVIRDVMKKKEMVAIARVVMAYRERIVMLEPFGKGILGTLLHHPYEILSEEAVFQEIPDSKLPDQMIRLAEDVIDSMTGDFEPEKQAGLPAPKKATAPPTNVINLRDALRRSA
jgi:DNA end-binding protein Ku